MRLIVNVVGFSFLITSLPQTYAGGGGSKPDQKRESSAAVRAQRPMQQVVGFAAASMAIQHGQEGVLRSLFSLGLDPNATDQSGNSLLRVASWWLRPSMIQLLLQRGATVLDNTNKPSLVQEVIIHSSDDLTDDGLKSFKLLADATVLLPLEQRNKLFFKDASMLRYVMSQRHPAMTQYLVEKHPQLLAEPATAVANSREFGNLGVEAGTTQPELLFALRQAVRSYIGEITASTPNTVDFNLPYYQNNRANLERILSVIPSVSEQTYIHPFFKSRDSNYSDIIVALIKRGDPGVFKTLVEKGFFSYQGEDHRSRMHYLKSFLNYNFRSHQQLLDASPAADQFKEIIKNAIKIRAEYLLKNEKEHPQRTAHVGCIYNSIESFSNDIAGLVAGYHVISSLPVARVPSAAERFDPPPSQSELEAINAPWDPNAPDDSLTPEEHAFAVSVIGLDTPESTIKIAPPVSGVPTADGDEKKLVTH